ncbi:MAG: peptidylprolyl isomerase [Planctomycetota bacterium]
MERGLTTILAFFVIVLVIVLVGKVETLDLDRQKAGEGSEERKEIERDITLLDYEEDLPVEMKKLQARWNIVNDLTVSEIETFPPEKLALLNVALITNLGTVILECFPDVAPNHTHNFLKLVNEGYYDGTLFHRIVPDFVIQAGQGARDVGYTLKAELSELEHQRGTLGMARTQASLDSASTQFYIALDKLPSLDKKYTIFGRVIFGMDVVDRIAQVPVGSKDRPKIPVQIWKAVILRPKGDGVDL